MRPYGDNELSLRLPSHEYWTTRPGDRKIKIRYRCAYDPAWNLLPIGRWQVSNDFFLALHYACGRQFSVVRHLHGTAAKFIHARMDCLRFRTSLLRYGRRSWVRSCQVAQNRDRCDRIHYRWHYRTVLPRCYRDWHHGRLRSPLCRLGSHPRRRSYSCINLFLLVRFRSHLGIWNLWCIPFLEGKSSNV
jgi:hypothetical protein